MEKNINQNPMPEIKIFPNMERIASAIIGFANFLPTKVLSRGDHTFEKKRGAAEELDCHLYGQPELEFGD